MDQLRTQMCELHELFREGILDAAEYAQLKAETIAGHRQVLAQQGTLRIAREQAITEATRTALSAGRIVPVGYTTPFPLLGTNVAMRGAEGYGGMHVATGRPAAMHGSLQLSAAPEPPALAPATMPMAPAPLAVPGPWPAAQYIDAATFRPSPSVPSAAPTGAGDTHWAPTPAPAVAPAWSAGAPANALAAEQPFVATSDPAGSQARAAVPTRAQELHTVTASSSSSATAAATTAAANREQPKAKSATRSSSRADGGPSARF